MKILVKNGQIKPDIKKENESLINNLDQTDSLFPNLIEFKFQKFLN